MNIIVLIKYVPDRAGPIEVNVESRQIIEADVVFDLGNYDWMAVEEALHLRDLNKTGTVTVITAAPSQGEAGLRKALELGADRAIRVWNKGLAAYDQWAVAGSISKLVKTMDYSLILTGLKSGAGGTGLIGTYLAEILKIPCITGVVQINPVPGENRLGIQRHVGKGDRWLLECPWPAVLTIEKSWDDPRYPQMLQRLKAKQTPIQSVDPNECSSKQKVEFTALTNLLEMGKARPKPKKIFTPDSNLTAANRMKMILSGGLNKKQAPVGEKNDGETGAKQIYDILVHSGIVKG